MQKYPALLFPYLREIVWGGDRLKKIFKSEAAESGPVGEAWLLTDRDAEQSIVMNGPMSNKTLREYIDAFPDSVGTAKKPGEFPLLIKLIDSHDDLSVQVHPDDEFALKVEGCRGKCEAWYIIDAEPGAKIIAGLSDSGSEKLFSGDGKADGRDAFREIDPRPGDVIFIPPGLVHSIGKGILLAEIQQNSDLTFRISDFGRLWGGKPRELHTEKARLCVKDLSDEEILSLRFSRADRRDTDVLCDCDFFTVLKKCSIQGQPVGFDVGEEMFSALTVVRSDCNAALSGGGYTIPLTFGSCVFLPAGVGRVEVSGDCDFLLSTPR